VVEVGSHVRYVKLGDRVAIDNNIRCGFCSFCRMGLSSQCVEIKTSALGVMRDGGYAEYCLVPEKQCFVLPDGIDDILGTQVETLATVVNGMNTLLMLPYDYVLILGFGPIGYLFGQFARNIAAKVAVTEIDPFRISVANDCGLTVWDPNEVDVVQKITDFTYDRKADIVIEATGNAIEQALQCVTPGGKVLPFGMDSSITAKVVPNDVTRWATKILGLYLGQNTMVPSIRLFQEKRLNMEPFFTKVIPFDQGLGAFDLLGLDLKTLTHHPKSAMKVVMKM
jgi:threonine dehydrogenase-like Zn-dependent dehydrogenase